MAKTVIDKVEEFLSGLQGTIDKGTAAVIIRAVDNGALEFKRTVEAHTPISTGGLRNSLTLVQQFRKGRYGYKVRFEGRNEYDVPFQLIANVLNYGRQVGIASTGRAISSLQGIGFVTKNLGVLRQIDEEIENKTKIGEWVITSNELILNDGTRISLDELNRYDKLRNSPTN